ncbi:unnamed protein product [Rangifer tarandus platyrhynchus]|uniref:Uncharacterized protein n=1 Tax=Rangifer tarandus platyrhynchus TaxID=3082113 RepID=A0AC59YB32_RANTA
MKPQFGSPHCGGSPTSQDLSRVGSLPLPIALTAKPQRAVTTIYLQARFSSRTPALCPESRVSLISSPSAQQAQDLFVEEAHVPDLSIYGSYDPIPDHLSSLLTRGYFRIRVYTPETTLCFRSL